MIIMEEEIPFWDRYHLVNAEINMNMKYQIGWGDFNNDDDIVMRLDVANEIFDDVLSSFTGSGKHA